jgi:hypothetical protein
MPHCKPQDLPSTLERWPNSTEYQAVAWGDMEISYAKVPQPLDCTTLLSEGGLPGSVCQCPHYGYLFEGQLRCSFPGSDWPEEVLTAGDCYYIPAGHVLKYEAKTLALDFSPGDAFRRLMDTLERKASRDKK